MKVRFFIVRHGERIDETQGNIWKQIAGHKYYDMPITENGKKQAKNAALALKDALANKPTPHRMLVSPLLRAVQTAAELRSQFPLPIELFPAAASVALVFRGRAVERSSCLSLAELAQHVPAVKIAEPQVWDEKETFIDGLKRIGQEESSAASSSSSEIVVLVVAHRENIRLLSRHFNLPKPETPYCCIFELQYCSNKQDLISYQQISPILENIPSSSSSPLAQKIPSAL